MTETFSLADWAQINAVLSSDPAVFGFPERRDGSVILKSWNIRKFGAFAEDGIPKKTPGAFDLIERVCAHADMGAPAAAGCRTDRFYS